MCGPLLTAPNRHELYIDLQYTFSSSYFCGGRAISSLVTAPAPSFPYAAFSDRTPVRPLRAGKSLEICAYCEHQPRHYEDGAHPRHCGHCRGDGLDDPLSARLLGALRHLPGEGFAALTHRPALDGREQGGCVGKSF